MAANGLRRDNRPASTPVREVPYRITLYFILHPGTYSSQKTVRRDPLRPATARAIAEALAGKDGDVAALLERYFEADRRERCV